MISAVCFFAARQRNTVTVALLFSVLKPLQKRSLPLEVLRVTLWSMMLPCIGILTVTVRSCYVVQTMRLNFLLRMKKEHQGSITAPPPNNRGTSWFSTRILKQTGADTKHDK